MYKIFTSLCAVSVFLSTAAPAQDNQWVPVTGAEILHQFMSGLTAERQLAAGEVARAEYAADGTGVLYEWGASFPRTWEVKDDEQLCFKSEQESGCYLLEKNATDADLYRVKAVSTGEYHEFRVTNKRAVAAEPITKKDTGVGAAKASAAEIAAELANPNTPLASMTFKLQFRGFKGDLPNTDDQTSSSLLFQPSLPFPVGEGKVVFFRPAIPVFLSQPVFDSATSDFDTESALGDISFDFAYGVTKPNGTILAAGIVSSLPTATRNGLGSDRFTLGPEFMIGKISKTTVLGMFPNHQWDVGGSGDKDISLTTAQFFGIYLPGGGWNIGTTPVISYDHISEEWTVPLNITGGKTVIWNGRPWKLGMEVNYYLEQPDAFGPEWMVSFNIAPVVKNGLVNLFGLGD